MKTALTTLLLSLLLLSTAYAKDPFARWESSIAAFEKADKKDPPPTNATLFVGSSSIRMWNLDPFFPDLKKINRGFGGSTIADSIHFFDRLIQPLHPSTIVLYAGDNDISRGLSATQVLADFKQLTAKVAKSLPGTSLIYIAIKPSISRKKLWPVMKEANALIAAYCEQLPTLYFADIATPMLEQNLAPDLFKKDGLHLTDKGYDLWEKVIAPLIKKSQR
ncbi:MAG: GDSL-type esterase/lipase family protein [Verrucomicrobiales bacterium]|nr:GDSL-type esterase/lipase family protein [Verrucomicrobiales bacterium]